MLHRLTFLLAVVFLFVSCDKIGLKRDKNSNRDNGISSVSIRQIDDNIKQVYTAVNNHDKEKILSLVQSSSPGVRANAIYAWASLGDTSNRYLIVQYLDDTTEQVRKAAAYALGLTRSREVQDFLIKRYYNEPSPQVRAELLEAIGRCGSESGLYLMSKIKISSLDTTVLKGLAYGLVRFSVRGTVSKHSTEQALRILSSPQTPDNIKRIISFYFLSPAVDVSHIFKSLINVYNQTDDKYVKANILKAIGEIDDYEVRGLINEALKSGDNYLRTAAFIAYTHNPGAQAKQIIKYLNDRNTVIARLAAEYFIYNGRPEEAGYYFEVAKLVRNWQARSLMFHAALKYAPDSLRPVITRSIITGYRATENKYEKAGLLSALSYNPMQFGFVRDQTFYAKSRVVSTAGIKTLVKMRYHPEFDKFAREIAEKQQDNLNEEFGLIFKEAMRRGDNAMIFYSANILRNKKLGLIDQFDNTYFINQALTKLKLPRDLRVYKSVCKLMELYVGDTCQPVNLTLGEIDWNLLSKIEPDQKVVVKTSKGQFVIRLYPDKAPAAVAAFVKLLLNDYYDDTYIYRVVPGKMVMASSRRGDGWPDENIVNNVQLSGEHFDAGAVAMQLVDGKLESVQWLVTLEPSPQLDGKYTVFGRVVEGMDVVQRLDVSDQIFSIDLL